MQPRAVARRLARLEGRARRSSPQSEPALAVLLRTAVASGVGVTPNSAHLNEQGLSEMQFEDELLKDMETFFDDIRGFVQYAFAWGEGELADFDGPDAWQAAQHDQIGEQ